MSNSVTNKVQFSSTVDLYNYKKCSNLNWINTPTNNYLHQLIFCFKILLYYSLIWFFLVLSDTIRDCSKTYTWHALQYFKSLMNNSAKKKKCLWRIKIPMLSIFGIDVNIDWVGSSEMNVIPMPNIFHSNKVFYISSSFFFTLLARLNLGQ